MINNEEGSSGNISGDTSSDPFDQKLDGCDLSSSPVSSPSNYSSCGESEFERYCSANSVMGTPSLYGSSSNTIFHEFNIDSEFGSLRSLEGGDANLESLSGGEFDRNNESSILSLNQLDEEKGRIGCSDGEEFELDKGVDGNYEKRIVLASSCCLGKEGKIGYSDDGGDSEKYSLNKGFAGNCEKQIVLASSSRLGEKGEIGYDGGGGDSENFGLNKGFDGNKERRVLLSSLDSLGEGRVGGIEQGIEKKVGCDGLNVLSRGSNLYDDKIDFSCLEEVAGVGGNDMGLLGFVGLSCNSVEGSDREDGKDGLAVSCQVRGASDLFLSSAENSPTRDGAIDVDSGNRDVNISKVGNGSLQEVEEGSPSRVVVVKEAGSSFDSALQFDGRINGMVSEEETLSRNEHSDSEDSIFGDGSDREYKIGLHRWNVQHHREKNTEFGNPLLMNSSAAFGSQDWDDFEQEMGEHNLASATTLNSFEKQKQVNDETADNSSKSSTMPLQLSSMVRPEQRERKDLIETPLSGRQVKESDESVDYHGSSSMLPVDSANCSQGKQGDDVRDVLPTGNQVQEADDLAVCQRFSVSSVFQPLQDKQVKLEPLRIDLDAGTEKDDHSITREKVIGPEENQTRECPDLKRSRFEMDPLSDKEFIKLHSHSTEAPKDKEATFVKDHTPDFSIIYENNLGDLLNDSSVSKHVFENQPKPIKVDNPGSNESFDDIVNEMEEILLDSSESPGLRFNQENRMFQSQMPLPLRDGGSTASTSGKNGLNSLAQQTVRIDGVEVVGAKQKKGDVSLGERLVGVKEYTVYRIRVWSGNDKWEVERRYRDFFTLYRQLKTLYAAQNLVLPFPWSAVERESRKIFGNASPDVVKERSSLIEECLRSVLHSRTAPNPPIALSWFLSPTDALPGSPTSKTLVSQSTSATREANTENILALGKTISLIVENRPHRSVKQLLEAQHYICAGCHKYFDDGKTLMHDFVHTFGWGKPRLCEYTGQLFCSSCHTNDTAVLPARVLHHWDFIHYPVSQLAKSYLDSISDQPMLCVSAVNPLLFSKVPALLHIMNIRRRLGSMLPYVRCPFRRSINKGLGSRRYLLESNDFFALRDLIDLSRGLFAALPAMVETVSRKILEHITEQCLICCDVGVACGAKQACDEPSSLIFPFQKNEVEQCRSCDLVFHKPCFKKLRSCPCGAHIRGDKSSVSSKIMDHGDDEEEGGPLDLVRKKLASGLSLGLISGIFSKAKAEQGKLGGHNEENVILMGSLPTTSL